MSYWKSLLSGAFGETWDLVIGQPFWALLVALAGFLVGVRIKRSIGTEAVVQDTLTDALVGVASVAILMVFVFLVHVLFITPARMFRDKEAERISLEKQLDETKAMMANQRPRLSLQSAGIKRMLPDSPGGPMWVEMQWKVRNNQVHPAKDLEVSIFGIVKTLKDEPSIIYRFATAIEIDRDTPGMIRSPPLVERDEIAPMFIVLDVKYLDAVTGELYRQSWFFSWEGVKNSFGQGDFFAASPSDREQILAYFTDRNIDLTK